MISYTFPGKVVLVTGGSRGIGAELVRRFALAGATCLINYWPDPDGVNHRDAEELAGELALSAGGIGAPHAAGSVGRDSPAAGRDSGKIRAVA